MPLADKLQRVALVAYEFPPVQSGQAIRWYYLANGLAAAGVEVDVVAPDFPGLPPSEGPFHPRVRIERTFAGPFVGLSNRLAARVRGSRGRVAVPGPGARGKDGARGEGLAGKAYRAGRKILNNVLYPDVRSEWYPFAARRLYRVLRAGKHDCIVASHEPGVDAFLALRAGRRHGLPVVLDLGDPFVTPLAPAWRRRLDALVERRLCSACAAVVVTCEAMRAHLAAAGLPPDRIHVVPQGAPQAGPGISLEQAVGEENATLVRSRFTLVFTGTFYRGFRSPEALVRAVARMPGDEVLLAVAGQNDPWHGLLASLGRRVLDLGGLPHRSCLALQRAAAVLVNVGNSQPEQVPGKLYEYLGAGRPILHLGSDDAGARLLSALRRGLASANEPDPAAEALAGLLTQWREGSLDRGFDLAAETVAGHSWAARAESVAEILASASGRGEGG